MYIYKTVFDSEVEGKVELINKGVWAEVTEEGVTTMQYINGTQGVVNVGKVIEIPGTYGPDGQEIKPPVYYPGWAYDIMSKDWIDFGANEVYPGEESAHSFFGWPRDSEVPKPPSPPEDEEVITE